MNKKNLLNIFLSIIVSFFIYLIIYKQFVYPTIIPMKIGNTVNLFADWYAIISANLCKIKGVDVYLENPCDPWRRPHVYGPAWFLLPFVEKFPKFYTLYFPILFNFIFIFLIISFFKFENKYKNFFVLIYIFNISTLLAIERANNDILIFLIIALIALTRGIFFNHLLILIATFLKFYPLCLSIIFLFKKKFTNIFFNFLFLISIVSIIAFFQLENLLKIYEVKNLFSSIGIYGFSFMASLNTFLKIDNIFIQVLFLIPVLIIYYIYFKPNFKNQNIINLFYEDNYENRFYILCSTTILICYFLFSNFIYREIFLIGFIPWLIKNQNINNKFNFFDFYFYFLTFKFLISTFFVFLNMNKVLEQHFLIIRFIKHSLDFYLIIIILFIFLLSSLKLIQSFFEKKI